MEKGNQIGVICIDDIINIKNLAIQSRQITIHNQYIFEFSVRFRQPFK